MSDDNQNVSIRPTLITVKNADGSKSIKVNIGFPLRYKEGDTISAIEAQQLNYALGINMGTNLRKDGKFMEMVSPSL